MVGLRILLRPFHLLRDIDLEIQLDRSHDGGFTVIFVRRGAVGPMYGGLFPPCVPIPTGPLLQGPARQFRFLTQALPSQSKSDFNSAFFNPFVKQYDRAAG